MRTNSPLLAFLTSALLSFTIQAAPAEEIKTRPNFVLVLVDDLGWTDLGCYGSSYYETPHIDRLAREGIRFTNAYSACTVCSPSRAAILTGKYPARLHVTDWIQGHKRPFAKLKVPDWTMHLPRSEMNLPKALKQAGYATISIGKWHLGNDEFYPDKQGFDRNVGGTHRGQPPSYFAPYRIPTLSEGPPGEFLTDREAEEAVRFIRENKEKPFFVYLPHYAVHQPIAGKRHVIEKYRRKADPAAPHRNPVYAALIESVDDALGRIVAALRELNLEQRTIIIFTSDNGGLIGNPRNPVTSNFPLRDGKGSAYEGGVRVPLIVNWPGTIRAGTVSHTPVIGPDLFPTILELAGINLPPSAMDGESLVPIISRTGSLQRASIYWHYPHYHPGGATPYSAVREGDFKLIEFLEDDRIELYNLIDDVSESRNLSSIMPELAQRLRTNLHTWRNKTGAQMPVPNPDYDPSRQLERSPNPNRHNRKIQPR